MEQYILESQQVEYKKCFGKDVIISLSAFANSDGGMVIETAICINCLQKKV